MLVRSFKSHAPISSASLPLVNFGTYFQIYFTILYFLTFRDMVKMVKELVTSMRNDSSQSVFNVELSRQLEFFRETKKQTKLLIEALRDSIKVTISNYTIFIVNQL